MKLTPVQLRNIIREEIQKSINEAPMKPNDFYKAKSAMLKEVLNSIDSALKTLDNIQYIEKSQAMEEDTDISSAMLDLQPVHEFIAGIHSATVAMSNYGKADVGIDLDSLNTKLNTKLDTDEQKEFLKNLLAMDSDQLASQYSDISKEKKGLRPSMVPPGTPNEIIKMILKMAYPKLYGV